MSASNCNAATGFEQHRPKLNAMHHANKCFGTKWNLSCRRKDQVGLGIEVLEIKNSYLLSKWLYKLLSEEGLW
jgi:hypothetical protein